MKVGKVYKHTKDNDVVLIIDIKSKVYLDVLNDPNETWDTSNNRYHTCKIHYFHQSYKPFPQYKTELYKVLNS